jgi:hypothetical protein
MTESVPPDQQADVERLADALLDAIEGDVDTKSPDTQHPGRRVDAGARWGSRWSHLWNQEMLIPRIAQVTVCGTRYMVLWSATRRATLTSSPR